MHSTCVHSLLLSNHCENSDKVCDVLKIQIRLRASVQHTVLHTVAGMYKNCTKEKSPEIGI